jgi:pyruvate dehydrogenase E2 component (dihydrolipoamide acetyltransferase)
MTSPVESPGAARARVSPLARRMARELGIDLAAIAGSGPEGRIVKRDVERARAAAAAPGTPAGPPRAATGASMPGAVTPHPPLRAMTAGRIGFAQRTVPQLVLEIDCRLDALLAARRADGSVSLTAHFVKALALALADVPAANVGWSEAGVMHHAHSDVAVSIAVEGGHLTPVLKQVDEKPLTAIARELRDLAFRARSGHLEAGRSAAGSSAIHNLGMHGIARLAPIVEPPQATCLAIGTAEPRPVVAAGQLTIATVANCTLAADLRVVDGVVAATLLSRLKMLIEAPARLWS